jgi:GT2 family glycosyltransferase/glycosyltransferase involved in cell wall biosynthesis
MDLPLIGASQFDPSGIDAILLSSLSYEREMLSVCVKHWSHLPVYPVWDAYEEPLINQLRNRIPSVIHKCVAKNVRQIALYGAGLHTRMLLPQWRNAHGPEVKQIIVSTTSDVRSLLDCPVIPAEKFNPDTVDAIVLSSRDYEEEMYRSCRQHWPVVPVFTVWDFKTSTPEMFKNAAHESMSTTDSLHRKTVYFFPDYRATNPYQTLMYHGLEQIWNILPGSIDDALTAQRNSKQSIVFHLQWTSPIIGTKLSREEITARIAIFLQKLDEFSKCGGFLLWTIHNASSHENPHLDLEAYLYKELAARSSFIHVHSDAVIAFLKQHCDCDLPEDKVILGKHGHYIGVYQEKIEKKDARAQLGLPIHSQVLLFVGQIRRYKGVEDLIEAFKEIPEDIRHNAILVIAGQPFGFEMAEIESLKKAEPYIYFHPHKISDEEIHIWLSAADFVVLPYRKILTSGVLYLALSYGIPVIGPNSGLIPEIVLSGNNGFLYDANQPESLRNTLTQALSMSSPEISAFAMNAMKTAHENTWDSMRLTLSRAFTLLTIPETKEHFLQLQIGQYVAIVRAPLNDHVRHAKLIVVILHYKNITDTVRSATSVISQMGNDTMLHIVSNDEDLNAFYELCALFPQATVIQSPENLGYAGGNNLSLEFLNDVHIDYDYVLLLNPDIFVPDGALQTLMHCADAHPHHDIFGPAIVFGNDPSKIWFGGGHVSWNEGLEASHAYLGMKVDEMPKEPREVDYVTGACLLFRKCVLDSTGLLPEKYFLYFEETDWCLNAKINGHSSIVFPDITVIHHKRSENNGCPTNTFLYYYCRNALIFTKAYNPGKLHLTEVRIREKISAWMKVISTNAPESLTAAREAAELGIRAGHQGETGRSVNFAQSWA